MFIVNHNDLCEFVSIQRMPHHVIVDLDDDLACEHHAIHALRFGPRSSVFGPRQLFRTPTIIQFPAYVSVPGVCISVPGVCYSVSDQICFPKRKGMLAQAKTYPINPDFLIFLFFI